MNENIKTQLKNELMNAYKATVPANVRMLVKTFTNPNTVTENNFTDSELETLRNAALNAESGSRKKITYDDYKYDEIPQNPYSNESIIKQTLKDKGYQMANSIGRANLHKSPKGNTHISDRYDFAPAAHDPEVSSSWGGVYRKLHALAEEKGKPMGVDINLGRI
jgi:hypothetical protein